MTWRATSAARPWLLVAVAIATESTCQDRKRLGADCRYCAGLATIEARDFARLCNTNLVERMHLPRLRSDPGRRGAPAANGARRTRSAPPGVGFRPAERVIKNHP